MEWRASQVNKPLNNMLLLAILHKPALAGCRKGVPQHGVAGLSGKPCWACNPCLPVVCNITLRACSTRPPSFSAPVLSQIVWQAAYRWWASPNMPSLSLCVSRIPTDLHY